MYWLIGLGIGVGAYVYYNVYVDPYISLTGPMGMRIWKRQSQVTPEMLEFERKVQAGEIRT